MCNTCMLQSFMKLWNIHLQFLVFVPKQLLLFSIFTFLLHLYFYKNLWHASISKDGNCSDVTKPKNNSIYLFIWLFHFILTSQFSSAKVVTFTNIILRLMWYYYCSTHPSTYHDKSNKRILFIVLFLFHLSILIWWDCFNENIVLSHVWEMTCINFYDIWYIKY